MSTKIFINLPVTDLNKTIDFFTKLGFKFNPMFTNENATSMIIGEDISVMLLTENFFKTFTSKDICDSSKSTEVILCLSAENREAVDEMVKKAVEAGGTTPIARQDNGWMYGHGFQDIDGHLWEIMWMDVNAMPKNN